MWWRRIATIPSSYPAQCYGGDREYRLTKGDTMAIFEAEHRRRTTSEDQLTSRIFGALSIVEIRSVLTPFLVKLITASQEALPKELMGLLDLLSDTQTNTPHVELWARFGLRCPDVCVKVGKYLVLIEVKENTKATADQIVEQYNAAKKESPGQELVYCLLSNKDEDSLAVDAAKARLKHDGRKLFSVRWNQVWEWLDSISGDKGISGTTDERLLKDLVGLLEDRQMKQATEIKSAWFTEETARSVRKINELYTELRLMVSYLIPRLEELELKEHEAGCLNLEVAKPKKPADEQVLVSPQIEIKYADRRWKRSLRSGYLSIYADLLESSFSVGFCNSSMSDEDCDALEDAAIKEGFYASREPPKKGRTDIGIWRDLIEGPCSEESGEAISRKELVDSVKDMRDFVRRYYGIRQEPTAGSTAKRRR